MHIVLGLRYVPWPDVGDLWTETSSSVSQMQNRNTFAVAEGSSPTRPIREAGATRHVTADQIQIGGVRGRQGPSANRRQSQRSASAFDLVARSQCARLR
jgi:hypothetical protein